MRIKELRFGAFGATRKAKTHHDRSRAVVDGAKANAGEEKPNDDGQNAAVLGALEGPWALEQINNTFRCAYYGEGGGYDAPET